MITDIKINDVESKILDLRPDVNSIETQITFAGVARTENTVILRFRWDAMYTPDIGYMKFEGAVKFSETPKNLDAIEKQWEEKQTLPEAFVNELATGINHFCATNSALIARAMDFTPAYSVPAVKAKEA